MKTTTEEGISMTSDGDTRATESRRTDVRRRLEAKRGLATNVVAYLVINAFLVLIWALSGAGYFWPAWVLLGWGVGLLLHAWDVFGRKPVTEADVDNELRRQGA